MSRTFNGTSDKIVVNGAHLWTNLANFSLAAWFKTSSGAQNVEVYIEQASTHFAVLGIASTTSKLRWTVDGTDTSGYRIVTAAAVNDGVWHHACWTQDSSGNFALYLDGTLVQSGTATPPAFTPSTVTIGAATSGSNVWNGSLAHLATWSRKLTSTEVATLAGGALPSTLSPIHYWTLAGDASPEPDSGSATHVDGVLTGTTKGADDPPVAASSAIKTIAGLAKASVKTINGVAIASVKTVEGLA